MRYNSVVYILVIECELNFATQAIVAFRKLQAIDIEPMLRVTMFKPHQLRTCQKVKGNLQAVYFSISYNIIQITSRYIVMHGRPSFFILVSLAINMLMELIWDLIHCLWS